MPSTSESRLRNLNGFCTTTMSTSLHRGQRELLPCLRPRTVQRRWRPGTAASPRQRQPPSQTPLAPSSGAECCWRPRIKSRPPKGIIGQIRTATTEPPAAAPPHLSSTFQPSFRNSWIISNFIADMEWLSPVLACVSGICMRRTRVSMTCLVPVGAGPVRQAPSRARALPPSPFLSPPPSSPPLSPFPPPLSSRMDHLDGTVVVVDAVLLAVVAQLFVNRHHQPVFNAQFLHALGGVGWGRWGGGGVCYIPARW